MKTKTWVLLIAAVLAVCVGLSLLLLGPVEADSVRIYSEGELLATLSLHQDRTMTVESAYGTNTITVSGGKIAVTDADCPDGYCMDRGYCSGGTQIVCLPNRLVIQFVNSQTIDAISG